MEILDLVLRTISFFLALLIFTRLMGKKQLSQLTFFNYIAGITFGSIVANAILNDNVTWLDGVIALIIWTSLPIVIDKLNLKFPKLRLLIDDEPEIIIKHGELIRSSLKKENLNIDTVTMLLRRQGVFSIKEVDYALLEPDGKISIIKANNYKNVTKKDLNIEDTSTYTKKTIPTTLISDGIILYEHLKKCDLTEEFIYEKIGLMGLKAEEVFFAQLQEDMSLVVQAIK